MTFAKLKGQAGQVFQSHCINCLLPALLAVLLTMGGAAAQPEGEGEGSSEPNTRQIRNNNDLRSEVRARTRSIRATRQEIERLRKEAKIPAEARSNLKTQLKEMDERSELDYQKAGDVSRKIAREAEAEANGEDFCCNRGAEILDRIGRKYQAEMKQALKEDAEDLKRDKGRLTDEYINHYDKESARKIRRLKLKAARADIERMRASVELRFRRFVGVDGRGANPSP